MSAVISVYVDQNRTLLFFTEKEIDQMNGSFDILRQAKKVVQTIQPNLNFLPDEITVIFLTGEDDPIRHAADLWITDSIAEIHTDIRQ